MNQFISFDPVVIDDWIINLSVHIGFNVVMMHRYKHTCKCAYVPTMEDVNSFIKNTVIDAHKEQRNGLVK